MEENNHITIYNQPDCILPKSFFEGRFIPNFHPESLDYEQWWDEQIRRCKEGWSDGGYYIPGVHYYHLNMKKINMLDKHGNPMIGHPYFAYEDQQLFLDIMKAKENGKGIMLITGRGFGKSFDTATVAEHGFVLHPAYEVIVSASTDFFAKKIWYKIQLGLNSLPDDLRPNFLKNTQTEMESGLKIFEDGKEKIVGFRSVMNKVVYDNDEGRTRGTRPNIHVFEEIGSWTGAAGLIDCYKATEPSWWRGKYFTSLPILIGTGGQMKSGGSEDAKKMAYNPEAYNLMVFRYEEENNEPTCRFVPAYKKFEGTYERTGLSRELEAKEILDGRREDKKKDIDMYLQETMEFPYTLTEAFQISGSNFFTRHLLEDRYAHIQKTPELKNMVQRGYLDFVKEGSRIIGVKWRQHPNGPFEIVEHPKFDETGKPVKNLYIGGCDSFDAVAEESEGTNRSAGSHKIYKRFWKASETGNIFVASITQRTKDAEEFYWNTVKLNMYYECKMLYEHTKIGIAQHYITNKLHRYLYERPRLDEAGVIKKTTSTNRYGLTMPDPVKKHAIIRYASYIDKYIENMYLLSQIKDALEFRWGSNKHDETMASALCIIADDDMHNLQVKEREEEAINFPAFRRDAAGNLQFS